MDDGTISSAAAEPSAAPYVILEPFPAFAPHHTQHCPNTSPNKQRHSNTSDDSHSDQHETKRQKSDSGATPIRRSSRIRGQQQSTDERDGEEDASGVAVDGMRCSFRL